VAALLLAAAPGPTPAVGAADAPASVAAQGPKGIGLLTPGKMQKLYKRHRVRVLAVAWAIPGLLLVIGAACLAGGVVEIARTVGSLLFFVAGVVMWVFAVLSGMMSLKHGVPPFATVPIHIFASPLAFLVLSMLLLLRVDLNYPVRNWLLLCGALPLGIVGFAYSMGYLVFTYKGLGSKLKSLGDGLKDAPL